MPKILIIDDDPFYADITSAALKGAGNFEVMTENRSESAITTIRAFMPDLILLDIMMPGALGTEIADKVMHDPALQHIKVVFLTGLIRPGEERSHDAGDLSGPRVIPKSTARDTLIGIIHQELGI